MRRYRRTPQRIEIDWSGIILVLLFVLSLAGIAQCHYSVAPDGMSILKKG